MINFVAWLGTAASIAGSFTVALGAYRPGYVLFTAGSLCWLAVAWSRRDRALGVLNGTFLAANVLGIVNNFF